MIPDDDSLVNIYSMDQGAPCQSIQQSSQTKDLNRIHSRLNRNLEDDLWEVQM